MSFVCLNCNHEFDVKVLKPSENGFICPNKNCKSKLYEVDNMLLPIVLFLYKNGFEIIDCKSSSLTDEKIQDVRISLCLSRYIKKLYITEEHLRDLFEYIDNFTKIMYNENSITITFEHNNVLLKKAYCQLLEDYIVLVDWCNTILQPLCDELDSSWCEGEEVSEDVDRGVLNEEFEELNENITD